MLFWSTRDAYWALTDQWDWPNFSITELACRCGGRFCAGEYWHDPGFLDRLQLVRDAIGQPLTITSGHRCAQWNAYVGGAPRSEHKRLAVDVSLQGRDRHRLYRRARDAGFTGFGLARQFLHLDRRAARAVWYYPGSRELWQI